MTDTQQTKRAEPAICECEIVTVLRSMPEDRVLLVAKFIVQAKVIDDPEAVETFIRMRDDPKLDTLLNIASKLDSEALDQLLFTAEDLAIDTIDP